MGEPMKEFEMIRDYFKPLTMDRAEAGALLDDAAILDIPEGFDLVMSSDTLNGGVHFLADEDPAHIAHKCLRVNLSDMAAMGAKPYCYQLNLAFSNMPDAPWAKRFAETLLADQKEFGIFCSGGDTTVIEGPLLISMTVTGLVPKGQAVKRSGAKVGDLVVVSGTIGDPYIGVQSLLGLVELENAEYFHDACHKPMPRTPISLPVCQHANACIDISDGLIADLSHVCHASGVGAKLQADKVPISDEACALVDAGVFDVRNLLTGGDDYELGMAIAPSEFEAFEAAAKERGVDVHVIGEFVDGDLLEVFDKNGNELEFDRKGWTHF